MIKCLIFDCDGTLVDSELLCNLGLVLQLKEYGVNLSSIDLMQKYRGGKLADILKSIEKEHSIVLKEDFEKNYRIRVDHLFERALTPCKGVIEFLAQNTLSVCVASSGPIKKINFLVLMRLTLGNLILISFYMLPKRWASLQRNVWLLKIAKKEFKQVSQQE